MKSENHNNQTCRAIATRSAVLAAAAPWRHPATLATLALALGGFVSTAYGELQVYEGFNYTVGESLNAQIGGSGFAEGSAWTAANTNTYPSGSPSGFAICDAATQTLWNGTVTSVPQTGKYAGSPAPAGNATSGLNGNNPDHEFASRPLHPDIVATFTLGAVTWMSYVEASNFKANANGTGGSFAIGQGILNSGGTDNRGWTSYGGPAIGIGVNSAKQFTAAVWDPTTGTLGGPAGAAWINNGTPQIGIAKIVWGDAATPTTIYQATFTNGTVLTEAAFDAAAVTNSVTIDPTTFTNLALGGARYNVDELRIGTTFNDAIGVVVASYGTYWAPEASGGGTGTWSAAATVWSSSPLSQGTLAQSPTDLLIFAGATGTVTLSGTVTAAAGLEFATGAYSLVGASPAKLSLSGVDATANTLTIVTGTTTISSEVSGGTGLTKAGSGTLALSGAANTYGGGTLLNTGTLQIAALGSLGTGKVTFGGGTLQYPAGSGASSIDVSGKVETVASGQVAKIDTDGNDVTFATAIGGEGGLTKLGGGSLTLAATNTYTGPTTVSAGTLNLSSASGTIATLDVPVGGTVNLGAGAAVNILNVTGGTVNITGAGVQVDTLFASSGIIDASAHALAVANSASLSGTTFTRSGASPLSLSGSNLVAPTSVSHTTLAADGGTLSLVATGLDAAIGKGAPGIPALPATATFSGSGAWALNGGLVQSFNNDVYGDDNHAFHYIQVPSGDFDIKVHVTAVANARAGLMARDNLVSRYDSHAGASAVIWTGASATTIGGVMSATNITTPGNPWLKITRVGDIVTTYYSSDDIDYTQDKQQDYTASPWGETTYLGLDMTDTTSLPGTASATYEGVNFMGTASMPDLSTTELVLSGGAVVNVECPVKLAKLTIGGVVQPVGTYDATTTPLAISGAGSITIGTIVPVSDYDTWALGFFPTPGDPNALATADPDMDGMTNHKEYAFGLKPNDAASANPITAPLHKVSGQFSYTRRATPTTTGLAYSVWTSTDLVTWALDAGAAESITTSGDIQMVTVTVSASLLTGAQMFVRVQTQ